MTYDRSTVTDPEQVRPPVVRTSSAAAPTPRPVLPGPAHPRTPAPLTAPAAAPAAAPAPDPQPPSDGPDPALADAFAAVAAASTRAPGDQVEVFAALHARLVAALAGPDSSSDGAAPRGARP